MKEIMDRLSSYNIFNYLLPGVLLAVFGSRLTDFALLIENPFAAAFLYYFYGLVVSRIGSLLVEPILKRLGYVSHSEYEQYVSASKSDDHILILSEVSNMYRTLSSLFLCLIVVISCEFLSKSIGLTTWASNGIALAAFGALFAVSYVKQSAYVVSRIAVEAKAKNDHGEKK